MNEIKTILDAQGRAFEEFKTTNDALIKAKAEGKAVGDLETKLAKIDTDLSNMSELKAEFDALAAKVNRPARGAEETESVEKEVKSFNQMRKAAAGQGATVADISD